VTFLAWLVGVIGLLSLSTITGGLHDVVVTFDRTPLVFAGGPSPDVVGYLGVGIVDVYVPWTVLPTLALGELAIVSGVRGRYLVSAALGVVGAGQLLVLSGCACGGSNVAPLLTAALTGLG